MGIGIAMHPDSSMQADTSLRGTFALQYPLAQRSTCAWRITLRQRPRRAICPGARVAAEQRRYCTRDEAAQKRRDVLLGSTLLATGFGSARPAEALPGFQKAITPNRRKLKIPDSDYKQGPEGLKYYDVEVGTGAAVQEGSRVAVHYDVYWRGITFMTSRQGMGVTGGTPLGFDVGAKASGGTLKGLDLGVRGMRVGGQRKLVVPPDLAYGERGMREIPPNATLTMDVQLLSIKTSPFGYRTKLVEG